MFELIVLSIYFFVVGFIGGYGYALGKIDSTKDKELAEKQRRINQLEYINQFNNDNWLK